MQKGGKSNKKFSNFQIFSNQVEVDGTTAAAKFYFFIFFFYQHSRKQNNTISKLR